MDIGPVTRPVPSASIAPVRAEAVPVQGAVATELPGTQAVPSVGDSQAARLDISPQAKSLQKADEAVEDVIKRNLDLDPDTRAVVYKATDTRTGRVVEQIPDEALLKLRAYARTQQQQAARTQADLVEKIA